MANPISPANEPEFIVQTNDVLTNEQRWDWLRSRADEARAQGAVLFRASVHPTTPNRTLFEAWNVYPADQGELRWQD